MTGGREVTEAEMDIKQWKRWMERRESGGNTCIMPFVAKR